MGTGGRAGLVWTDISVIIVSVTYDGRMTIVRQVRRGIRGKGRE